MGMLWRFEEDTLGLEVEIAVPSTQAFIADVHLRQWANVMNFMVTSTPVYQNGISAEKYSDKMYKHTVTVAKNKSVDMQFGNFLFGNTLAKVNPEYKSSRKPKNVKLGKTYE